RRAGPGSAWPRRDRPPSRSSAGGTGRRPPTRRRGQPVTCGTRRAPIVSRWRSRAPAQTGGSCCGWGRYAAFREMTPGPIAYEVVDDDEVTTLEDVQWAEWDADGRLLVATREGRLEVRDGA